MIPGNGMTWATSFKSIDAAINASGGNAEIWVKQGHYLMYKTMQPDVTNLILYGGFSGIETNKELRNPSLYPTIIDGQNKISCFSNTNRVIIDGFTFQNSIQSAINNTAEAEIINCIFTDNSSESGGAINCHDNSNTKVINSIFFKNNSLINGGAINLGNKANIDIINCSFTQNSAQQKGAAIFCSPGSTGRFINSIFWEDNAESDSEFYASGASIFYMYSNIQGIMPDRTNISTDPYFQSPNIGNLRLQPQSPCIDIGDSNAVNDIQKDLDGNSRILDGNNDQIFRVDIGAYEYKIIKKWTGDINHSGTVDLTDLILALKATTELSSRSIYLDADVDEDGKIGLAESIYIIKKVFMEMESNSK